jgi:3-hydroxyisobutyrate dehydrogenase-like beta-hydroxyacid dehydrogenase
MPPVVGILSPGDMGAAIGRVLHDNGLQVMTCLEGRSELTRLRAQESGFEDTSSYDDLVSHCDVLLSVLVPSEATNVAQRVAEGLKRTSSTLVYVDCNAIAPQTVERLAAVITGVGASFVDAGIIGSPPRPGSSTRLYCSGPDCHAFEALSAYGLDVRLVGPRIGQASGLKMVYAASTKGTTALWTELLVAAKALGLGDQLAQELKGSTIAQQAMRSVPSMPRRSRRWIGEMEEIAATFESLGLTPLMLQGAAELYRFVGETHLADQTSREPDPPLDTVLDVITATSATSHGE